MASSQPVERLSIPVRRVALDSATRCRVGIDSGCLLTKIVFLTEGRSPGEYTMNFLLMENAHVAAGLDIVKRECGLLRRDGTDVLKITGVGYKHEQLYHQVLGAGSEFVVEPLCWIRGYHWAVENLDPEDLFYPHERSDPCFCQRDSAPALDRLTGNDDAIASNCRRFPAVLVNAGSSVGMCIVNAAGEAVQVSLSFFSCKTLVGLASMLVGASDFDEIVRLAEAGERGNVDLKVDELTAEDPLHPFGAYNGDIPMVHLGKIADAAVAAGSAKREDVARSLVSLFCFNLFSTVLSFAAGAGVCDVYLGGNCFRHALFRREFENARAFQLHHHRGCGGGGGSGGSSGCGLRHHFLRVGAQVASIGALVSTNDQVPDVLKFAASV